MKPSFVILAALLVFFCNAQPVAISRTANLLNGPVKSVSLTIYNADEKFGDLVKGSVRLSQTDEYNKAGFLVSTKETDRSVTTRYSYKYDKNNKLIEKKTVSDDEEKIEKFTYSPDGLLVEADTWDNGKLTTRLKNKYTDGKITLASLYHGDGKLKESETFEYNDSRQLHVKSTLDAKENLIKLVYFSYDSTTGRVASGIATEREGDSFDEAIGVYFTYDKNGWITSRERLSNKGSSSIETFEFDPYGNSTKEYRRTDDFVTSEYTYDKQNNWITEIRRWNQGSVVRNYICERSISYY